MNVFSLYWEEDTSKRVLFMVTTITLRTFRDSRESVRDAENQGLPDLLNFGVQFHLRIFDAYAFT